MANKSKTQPDGQEPGDQSHSVNSAAGDAIGQKLKLFYDEVATEPVPDRFMDLLNQLDKPIDAEDDDADQGSSK